MDKLFYEHSGMELSAEEREEIGLNAKEIVEDIMREKKAKKPKAIIKAGIKKAEKPKETEKKPEAAAGYKMPETVKTALLGYIDLLESDIMDLAELIKEKSDKLTELKAKAQEVKDYLKEHGNDE